MLVAGSTQAHVLKTFGPYSVALGWVQEPTYVGQLNAVQVVVKDASGKAVVDIGDGDLKVVVSIGGQSSAALDLLNKFDPDTGLGVPGDYEAPLVPTAPGDYTFHLSGKIDDTVVDETATSSDSTFNSVVDETDIQFPTQLPSLTEITTRLDRLDTRVTAVASGRARRCRERAARHDRDRCRHGGDRRCHAGSRFRFDRAHRGRRARWAWGDPGAPPASSWRRGVAPAAGRNRPDGHRQEERRVGPRAARDALLASSVAAHALPQSSDPSAGANLTTAPAAVTITFGERPDPKLSTIKVLDTSGNVVSTGATTAVAADPLKLTVSLQPLSPGVYTVAWRTVSAVDGHSAAGSFAFGIGVAPSPVGTGATGGQGTASGDTGTVPGRDRRPLAVVPRIARHARCGDVRDHHRHPVRHAVPAAARRLRGSWRPSVPAS